MKFIIGGIILLILLAFIIFPEFRKKLKVLVGGFLNIFIEDAAKTPEGAEAVFSQAIQETQDKYNKASDTLNRLSGELKHAENSVTDLKKKIKETETACENFVRSNDMENAQIYAYKREELITELAQKEECIVKLKPMVEEAKSIYDAWGRKLLELKKNKKETVEKLKMNGQLKDLLGDLDELKRDSATDKMLGAIKEGSESLQKEVDGARVVHESRISTKISKAEAQANQLKTQEYLNNLKKKYGGN